MSVSPLFFKSAMDFFSRKILSDDDDDLNKLCYQFCPTYSGDSCPSDCKKKCAYDCFSIPPQNYSDQNKSHHKITNWVNVTVAVLSITFLLVLFYAVYARFYSRRRSRRRTDVPPAAVNQQEFVDEEHGPILDHPIWYIRTVGLPEAVIDAIAVCKFKSGEGLIDGTECSVCLSEFEEDETLRLLPKCSHAFHLLCIDTWLRSHTNCPMCRARVAALAEAQSVTPSPQPVSASEETQMEELWEISARIDEEEDEIHLGDDELEQRVGDFQAVRRSVSLDSVSALRISSVFGGVSEKMDCDDEIGQRNGNGLKKLSQESWNSSAAMNRSVSFSGKFLMRSSTQRSIGN